jgi:di-N-acetylchitobiase
MFQFLLLFAQIVDCYNCPCSPTTLCNRITKKYTREVLVWADFETNATIDYSVITVIGVYNFHATKPVPFLCDAHRNSVRVVLLTNFPVQDLLNATARQQFVSDNLQLIEDSYLDGINLDFESVIAQNATAERNALTDVVASTYKAFSTQSPPMQVTFDVAWSPDCIDERCYDYKALSDNADFLMGMFYDTRSQVFTPGRCTAGANTPTSTITDGLKAYAKLGNRVSVLRVCSRGST